MLSQQNAFIQGVWVGTRELRCWILRKGLLHGSGHFYIDIAGTCQFVWPNTSLTTVTCQKQEATMAGIPANIVPYCIRPPRPLRHTFALAALFELEKRSSNSVWQASLSVFPAQQGGVSGDTTSPQTYYPGKTAYGFLELGCCGKWCDQGSLFLLTRN